VRAAEGYRYVVDGNAFAALIEYGKGDAAQMGTSAIARYWHGYLVFLKPLLCLMSYLDIRMLLAIVQGGMLAAVIAGMCKRGLSRYLPAFLLSMLCITPWTTAFSMQFSTVLVTMLAAMNALLYLPEKRFERHGLWLFFLLVGMLTSYIDYLTYPLASFGMPFVLCVLLWPLGSAKDEWKRFILCGVCWAVGYLGMWAGKWVIAAIFGNEKWFWANLFAKIGERSSDATADTVLSYATVLKTVIGVFFKRAYALIGAAAAIAWLTAFIRNRKHLHAPASATALAASSLLPFAWYFCTQNHSYIHAFYTSRNLAVTVFAACCLFTSFLCKNLYKSNDL